MRHIVSRKAAPWVPMTR